MNIILQKAEIKINLFDYKHPEVLIMKEIDFEITNLEELTNEIKKASQLSEQLNQALENIKNFEPKIQVF
jgi:hypothetical protein